MKVCMDMRVIAMWIGYARFIHAFSSSSQNGYGHLWGDGGGQWRIQDSEKGSIKRLAIKAVKYPWLTILDLASLHIVLHS